MKDSRGRLPSGETPCPKISRKHAAGCKQQEVYWILDTQVPGANKSLGGLARPPVGGEGFL